MKKTILGIFACLSCHIITAQVFSSPESVDYDAPRNRWIVGQNGSGEVHVYDAQSQNLTGLVQGMTSGPAGIECVGDTVFCCDGGYIRGYSLLNGAPVFSVNLGGTFLNGITWDGGNYLYTTDFSAKKIYRLNIQDSSYGAIVSGLSKSPNGIIYDGSHNRCVFVNWGANAPVMAVDLADSSISTLKNTSIGNMDGITRGPDGSWYVTAWSPNSLQRFDSAFAGSPVAVMTSGLTSAADIDINAAGDSIGIPNSGTNNNVVFYVIPDTSTLGSVPDDAFTVNIYPNPAAEYITIVFNQPVLDGHIRLTDINGKVLAKKPVNDIFMNFHREGLKAGIYYIELTDTENKILLSRKIIFLE